MTNQLMVTIGVDGKVLYSLADILLESGLTSQNTVNTLRIQRMIRVTQRYTKQIVEQKQNDLLNISVAEIMSSVWDRQTDRQYRVLHYLVRGWYFSYTSLLCSHCDTQLDTHPCRGHMSFPQCTGRTVYSCVHSNPCNTLHVQVTQEIKKKKEQKELCTNVDLKKGINHCVFLFVFLLFIKDNYCKCYRIFLYIFSYSTRIPYSCNLFDISVFCRIPTSPFVYIKRSINGSCVYLYHRKVCDSCLDIQKGKNHLQGYTPFHLNSCRTGSYSCLRSNPQNMLQQIKAIKISVKCCLQVKHNVIYRTPT